MKASTRIRIILFALMIFGAFANFALNDWGNTIIVWCELLMAISFIGEIAVVSFKRIRNNYRKKLGTIVLILLISISLLVIASILEILFTKSLSDVIPVILISLLVVLVVIVVSEALFDFFKNIESQGIYESLFLCMFFVSTVFKNASLPGASMLLVLSILFLVPYFVTSTVKFFKENFIFGKGLVIVLTFGSFSALLLGIFNLLKTMHYPFATIVFYLAVITFLVMFFGALKWKYEFKSTKINILEGLRLFKTNIVLLFFMLFVYTSYRYLTIIKVAPDFYSADYPKSYYDLRNGNEWDKAVDIREAYDAFVEKAEINGFIK